MIARYKNQTATNKKVAKKAKKFKKVFAILTRHTGFLP